MKKYNRLHSFMTNEKITATEIKEILNDPGFIDYIHDSWLSAIKGDTFNFTVETNNKKDNFSES